MAVYTRLSIDDINEFLNDYSIGDCHSYSELTDGTTNTNYLIETDNKKYVLTVFEEIDDVSFLQPLYQSFKKNDFPSAQLIPTKSSAILKLNNKPALLFSYVLGSSVTLPTSKHCQLIAHYLATLHKMVDHFIVERKGTKDVSWAIQHAQQLLERDISDEDAEIILSELTYLKGFRQLSLPTGLIHADCFRDNVLFTENGQVELAGIIDFEYVQTGVLMFDLAIVINDWCSLADGSLDRLKMRDIIVAYNEVRPLESMENQSIPMMLRAAAFRFWISRLSDENKKDKLQGSSECLFCREKKGELQGSSECLFCQEQKKDPDEFKRILLNRRLSLSGMQNH